MSYSTISTPSTSSLKRSANSLPNVPAPKTRRINEEDHLDLRLTTDNLHLSHFNYPGIPHTYLREDPIEQDHACSHHWHVQLKQSADTSSKIFPVVLKCDISGNPASKLNLTTLANGFIDYGRHDVCKEMSKAILNNDLSGSELQTFALQSFCNILDRYKETLDIPKEHNDLGIAIARMRNLIESDKTAEVARQQKRACEAKKHQLLLKPAVNKNAILFSYVNDTKIPTAQNTDITPKNSSNVATYSTQVYNLKRTNTAGVTEKADLIVLKHIRDLDQHFLPKHPGGLEKASPARRAIFENLYANFDTFLNGLSRFDMLGSRIRFMHSEKMLKYRLPVRTYHRHEPVIILMTNITTQQGGAQLLVPQTQIEVSLKYSCLAMQLAHEQMMLLRVIYARDLNVSEDEMSPDNWHFLNYLTKKILKLIEDGKDPIDIRHDLSSLIQSTKAITERMNDQTYTTYNKEMGHPIQTSKQVYIPTTWAQIASGTHAEMQILAPVCKVSETGETIDYLTKLFRHHFNHDSMFLKNNLPMPITSFLYNQVNPLVHGYSSTSNPAFDNRPIKTIPISFATETPGRVLMSEDGARTLWLEAALLGKHYNRPHIISSGFEIGASGNFLAPVSPANTAGSSSSRATVIPESPLSGSAYISSVTSPGSEAPSSVRSEVSVISSSQQ